MQVFVKWEAFETITGDDEVQRLRAAVGKQVQHILKSGKSSAGGVFADGRAGFFVLEDFRPGLDLSTEKRPPIKLSDIVVGFNCKYLDPQSDDWKNEWVDRARMPKAVRVELVLKPEREGAKPITVASTANVMAAPATASTLTSGEVPNAE